MFDRKQLSYRIQEFFEVKITKENLEEVFNCEYIEHYNSEEKKNIISTIHDASKLNEYAEDVMKINELHQARIISVDIIKDAIQNHKDKFREQLMLVIINYAHHISFFRTRYFEVLAIIWFLLLALRENKK